MITTRKWIAADGYDPYRNLAIEEYLTMHTLPGECILYLWQNQNIVVIGKNQNCWKECNVNTLEEDGGHLVRRLSGGGAVYHDLGNLNFTFCVRKEDYDLDRQMSVILDAVQSLGIHAEKTGRNDITIDGRKFSGNAFLKAGDHYYHHGTLMLSVDGAQLAKYLTVDPTKLANKGVDSVRSRVASLSEFCPSITVDAMKSALVASFEKIYGGPSIEISTASLPASEIASRREHFASADWKYGRRIPFDYEISRRFDWGDVQLQFHVVAGHVAEVEMYSDAMDQDAVVLFREALQDQAYQRSALSDAIAGTKIPRQAAPPDLAMTMKRDIIQLIREKI